jgi:tetratricopeptide (TPR) repeat protein
MGLVLLGTAAGTLSEGGALVATPMQQVVSSSQGDPLQGRAAIAVLPLHSNDQDFVALRQQIIHKLSKLRIARLIANDAIGSQPHYRLAVESESASPGLAVVKLTDPTGIRLWQQEFKLGEAEFTLSDIAKQVGHETEIQLVRGEARAAARNDVDVTALLLAARAEQNRGQTGKEDARSVKLYERALRADGESAIAMAGIAGQLVARQLRSLVQDPEADRRAELLLRRSITIDPSLPMAHFFMGLLHKSRGHGNQAVLSFNRTLELNPSFAPAYANLGHALMLLGRPEEGMDNIRQAMRISPNDAYFATWAMFAGEIEFERGNVPVALGWFELALTRSPALARCYGWLAAAYQEVGDFAAASRHMQEFKALLGNLSSRKLSERLRQFPEGGLQQSRPRLYQALLKTADYVR